MSPAIPPTGLAVSKPPLNPRSDYRTMVEAIQAGDLLTARDAYARFTRTLPAAAHARTTTLGQIGARLKEGDLDSARGILDGLETKALKVLRAVQRVTEGGKDVDSVPPGSTYRIKV